MMTRANTHSYCRRRDFIRAGALSSILGISLPRILQLQAAGAETRAKAQSCILLWLEGGPSQVDTWDPKPNSSFKPISTNVPGIQLSSLLPGVARHMEKLAIIRSMHTLEQDHSAATHYAMTGHRQNPAMQFPSLGSIVSKELGPRNGLPAYVLGPQWDREHFYEEYFKSGFLGPAYNPLILSGDFQVPDLTLPKSVPLERIQSRRSLLKIVDRSFRQTEELAQYSNLDTFTEQALNMILSPGVKKAFDLSEEPQKTKEAYGLHRFGQSVLLARRLVENGCRFVTASGYKDNEWDTHAANDKRHSESLVPQLDQSLSALLEDLSQRGLLESTLVIAMGEFGRTPHHNANGGRDHWPQCWSLVLGGGGIRGGQIIGGSDATGAEIVDRKVTIGELAATVYKAFGIDWNKEYPSPIGRPIKIANSINDVTGEPIAELL